MKRELKAFAEKHFSRFLPFQLVAGAIGYFRTTLENYYRPSEFLHYGRNVRIGAGVNISALDRMFIGDNTAIDARCHIQAVGGCHIGRGCQIGAETIILTIEHQYTGGESLPYDSIRLIKPVYIEDFVWIGVRTSIAPGVRIGEGAIIGMGSVVVQDVPPLAIVAGNPAQVLTYRSKPDFDRLKEQNAIIDPYKELPLLKLPPLTKRKYRNELREFGFDLPAGKEFFHYDKSAPRGQALRVVDAPNGSLRHGTIDSKKEAP